MLRWFVGLSAALVAGVALAVPTLAPPAIDARFNGVYPHDPYPVSKRAQAVHQRLVVGDWHADTLLWGRDLLKRHDRGQVDVPRLIQGNVAIQGFTVVTKSLEHGQSGNDRITQLAMAQAWPPPTWSSLLQRALYQAQLLDRYAHRSDGRLRVIRTRNELDQLLVDRAAGQAVVGGFLGLEGGHALEGEIANVERLHAAGYRVLGLQHFFDKELGGSLHGSGAGLTDFGREVLQDWLARGRLIDLAHASQSVAWDVLKLTDQPVIVSHTGVTGACKGLRNYPDKLMKAIAREGGVIGVGYWKTATCGRDLASIVRSLNVAIDTVGVDHVSLGSDFDGAVYTPLDASELAAITDGLLDAGRSEDDVRKVMGGNLVRVLRATLP